jgi:ketosteroid isomerase-like protein
VLTPELVRRCWLESVSSGDVERLVSMVTDDIIVVHGNGRCVCGKDEVKTDFLKGFSAFSVDQNVSAAEVTARGKWAFEISEVETRLTSRIDAATKEFHSTTLVVLRRQSDGSWKVARVLGLVD